MTGGRTRGDIADPSLASLGRQRIAWADGDMPVLRSIRETLQQLVLLWGEVGLGLLPQERQQVDGVFGHGQVPALGVFPRRFQVAMVDGFHQAFSIALANSMWIAVGTGVLSLAAVLLLKELPLKTTSGAQDAEAHLNRIADEAV